MTTTDRVPDLLDLLDQTEHWVLNDPDTGQKRLVPLTSMTERHRTNVLRWLESHAAQIHQGLEYSLLGIGMMVTGEMASEDLDRTLETMADEDPLEWIRDTPLHRALVATTGRRTPATFPFPPLDPLDEETRPPWDFGDAQPSKDWGTT